MKKLLGLILLGAFVLPSTSPAIDLKQSKFTQVVNNVEIISTGASSRHTAAVNDVFSMPDVLRTGPDSRAELAATDGTITRVGANTIFSFDAGNRTIDLQQGSLLFHSPHGKGGGTIRTGSATASVIGTTIIVSATPNGGFKLLDLEGQAEVRFLNGLHQTLEPGQMTFILPGGAASPIIVFRLDTETKGSILVSGFDTPLDSMPKINAEITQQLLQILNGMAADTGLIVGNNATPQTVQVVMDIFSRKPKHTTPPPTPPLPSQFQDDAAVIGTDHTPDQSLPVNYSPIDPAHVQTGSFTLPTGLDSFTDGLSFLDITPTAGFIGNNIDIDTETVDLGAYSDNPDFEFMAAGDMKIWQSVDFDATTTAGRSPSLPATVALFAGGQMLIASGSTVEADTGTFGLSANSFGTLDTGTGSADSAYPNALNDVSIINNIGDVDILSEQDFTLLGTVSGGFISAGGAVDIESERSLTLGSGDALVRITGISPIPEYDVVVLASGAMSLTAECGDVSIYYSDLEADGGCLNISAGGNITINYTDVSANMVNLNADGDISVYDSFSSGSLSLSDWNIEAGGAVQLTADDNLCISDGYAYADGGNLNITAIDGNVRISDGDLEAENSGSTGGNVTIFGAGKISIGDSYISAEGSFDGDVEMDDAFIEQEGDEDITTLGGNISLTSSGNVCITDSEIDLGGNITISDDSEISADDGNVLIAGGGGTLIISGNDVSLDEDSTVSGNNINISGADISTTDGDVIITDGGGITITASGTTDIAAEINVNNISICNSTITTDGGNITIDNEGTVSVPDGFDGDATFDTISISGSTISASGNVDISANGDVTINGSQIGATTTGEEKDLVGPGSFGSSRDEVTISSGGELSITGGHELTEIDFNYDIGADSKIKLSGSDGVSIDGALIQTLDGCLADEIKITSDGEVDITDGSELDTSGRIKMASSDDAIRISDSSFYAGIGSDVSDDTSDDIETSGGEVKISADGTVCITDSTIDIAGDISVSADSTISSEGGVTISGGGGTLTICGSDVFIDDESTISGNNINISGATISAGDGDVDITDSGSITISAGDFADISGTVNANNINICNTIITADNGNVEIDNEGTASITGGIGGGTLDTISILNGSQVLASGNVDITANGDITISDSPISASVGNEILGAPPSPDAVTICSGGLLSITGNHGDNPFGYDIGADNQVILSGSDGVSLDDAAITTLNGGSLTMIKITGDGEVDITDGSSLETSGSVKVESYDDNVSIMDSTISADGDVCVISGGGMLTINSDAFVTTSTGGGGGGGGGVSYDIDAGGSVDLSGQCVGINSATIHAGDEVNITGNDGSVKINDVDIVTDGGGVNIAADNGSLTLADGSASHGVTITSGGAVNLSADDNVRISDTTISSSGGGIPSVRTLAEKLDSGLDTSGSDVDITGGGIPVIPPSDNISTPGNVAITAGGNVCITGSTIDIGGNIAVGFGGSIIIDTGMTIAEGGGMLNISGNDVSIDAGSTISGNNINISGSSSTISVTSGDVDITDSGSVTITANTTDISGTINVNNINISGTTITADDGNVIIDNEGTASGISGTTIDTISITGSTISASGNVDITANGDINISGSPISASVNNETLGHSISLDSVTISSGGLLSITGAGTDDIEADNKVTLSGSGGVSLDDTLIKTLDGDNSDEIKITGDGDINITDHSSLLDTYLAKVESHDGNVNILDSTISVGGNLCLISDDGMLTVNAGHEFPDVSQYDIAADGDVTLTGGSGVTVMDTVVHANGVVTITGGNVSIIDADIRDNGGDLDITAGNNGSLTLDSGDAAYGAYIEAIGTGSVNLTADEDVTISGSTIISDGGDVAIQSSFGSVDVSGTTLTAADDASIHANFGSVDLEGTHITATLGGVDIEAGYSDAKGSETLTVNGGDLNANGALELVAPGDVDINAGVRARTTLTAAAGELDVYANYGSADVENATITATLGNVNIDAGRDDLSRNNSETLTLVGDTISAANQVNLHAVGNGNLNLDQGGINIIGTSVTANSPSGEINVNNDSGVASIDNGSSMHAFFISVNSPDGILLNSDGSSGKFAGTVLNLTSGNSSGTDITTVENADLSTFSLVNMSAHTLNIYDTTFGAGSSVNLGSSTGTLNINTPTTLATVPGAVKSIPFDINLFNDNYGNTPINSTGQFTSGYSTSAGLHNYMIPN